MPDPTSDEVHGEQPAGSGGDADGEGAGDGAGDAAEGAGDEEVADQEDPGVADGTVAALADGGLPTKGPASRTWVTRRRRSLPRPRARIIQRKLGVRVREGASRVWNH